MPFGITADGFERHLQTNFLGHSLLILNLLPVLRPSESSLRTRKLLNLSLRSKVINLTSCVHRWVTPDLKLLNRATPEDEENYSIYYAYSYSKLLIIAFNFYLVKNILPKLNSNIRSVQIHPGGVASSMVIQSPINNILPVVKYESLFRNTFLWVCSRLVAAQSHSKQGRASLFNSISHLLASGASGRARSVRTVRHLRRRVRKRERGLSGEL